MFDRCLRRRKICFDYRFVSYDDMDDVLECFDFVIVLVFSCCPTLSLELKSIRNLYVADLIIPNHFMPDIGSDIEFKKC